MLPKSKNCKIGGLIFLLLAFAKRLSIVASHTCTATKNQQLSFLKILNPFNHFRVYYKTFYYKEKNGK